MQDHTTWGQYFAYFFCINYAFNPEGNQSGEFIETPAFLEPTLKFFQHIRAFHSLYKVGRNGRSGIKGI